MKGLLPDIGDWESRFSRESCFVRGLIDISKLLSYVSTTPATTLSSGKFFAIPEAIRLNQTQSIHVTQI